MQTKLKYPLVFDRAKFLMALTAPLCLSAHAQEEATQPNVLWITIEDTSPHFIGFYGNEQVITPNIDRLAREGVIFNHAFSAGPVSSASRGCIITGVNNGQLGTGNHRSKYPIPAFIKGFPSYLREAGIYTTNNRKTDYNIANEAALIADSWNESSANAGWWKRNEGQNFFSIFNFEDCHQSRTMTHPYDWYKTNVLMKLKPENITNEADIEIPPIYRKTPEMRTNLNRVYNAINLMDQQVGLLLNRLEKDGLMDNTIIFFFADHGEAIPRGKSSSIGLSYHVPFFIWFPEKFKHLSPWKPGSIIDELISLEDMPPTILSLKGIEVPEYMTGRPIMGKQRQQPRAYLHGARNRIDEATDLARTATDGRFFYVREFFQRQPQLAYQKYADVSDIVKSIRKDFSEGKLNEYQSVMCERKSVEYLYDLKNDPWELNNLAADPTYREKLEEMRMSTYNQAIADKDAHFLPEYEIFNLSGKTTLYEYVRSNALDIKEIIDAAYSATNPESQLEELYELLKSNNRFVRYWAMVGVRNRSDSKRVKIEEVLRVLNDDYLPVAIEAAAFAYEHYGDIQSNEILKNAVLNSNRIVSMHALQMLIYMPKISKDMIDTVNELYNNIKSKAPGYINDKIHTNSIDMVLHKHDGVPLFWSVVPQ